ncbi:hypothetical protein NOF55_17055 [Rhizobiaceae bacterium BDR2-2]|uniref:Succinoglycan biosynthesis protein exop n=1 Tax=Ectorhizobium quercum TaxID=2965071 RepID=A0AAE3MZQ0_9HYPH|nr:hypothetical protein [Ectorhizobium quercum]MCX8996137.1 hypothetical protein [Ectorhizobium quercum]MCX8998824.1 hypothetical protein [Ectorhizobium quercum]
MAFSLLFLASAALGGASLPFTFGEMFPRSFTSTAVVGIDASEAVDALASGLKSDASLDRVAVSLDLSREPLLAAGAPGMLAVAADLLAGTEKTVSNPDDALQRTLAGSLSVMPDRSAGRLSLAVTTPSPVLSERIANAFAEESLSLAAGQAVEKTYGLTAARKAAEDAEQALADHVATKSTGDLDAAARLAAEIAGHDADIASREAMLAALKDESTRIGALKVSDDAPAASDLGIDAPGFDDARQKYIAAKLDYERLAVDLGPRHPRLLAARGAADDARNRFRDALGKLEAGYKEKVQAASRALDQAKAERQRLESGPAENGQDLEKLEALKGEADRLRAGYLDKLDASRTSPSPVPARILAPAHAQTVIVNGVSPLMVSLAGAATGLLIAFGWLCLSARRRTDDADVEPAEVRQSAEPHPAPRHRPDDEYGYDDEEDGGDGAWGPPPAQNDDMPLAERLRAVLRRSAEMDRHEAMPDPLTGREAEIEAIRRRMEALKHRVRAYQAGRSSSRF